MSSPLTSSPSHRFCPPSKRSRRIALKSPLVAGVELGHFPPPLPLHSHHQSRDHSLTLTSTQVTAFMEVPSSATTTQPPPISIVLNSCFTQLWAEKRFLAMLETISVGPSSIRPKDFSRLLSGGQWVWLVNEEGSPFIPTEIRRIWRHRSWSSCVDLLRKGTIYRSIYKGESKLWGSDGIEGMTCEGGGCRHGICPKFYTAGFSG